MIVVNLYRRSHRISLILLARPPAIGIGGNGDPLGPGWEETHFPGVGAHAGCSWEGRWEDKAAGSVGVLAAYQNRFLTTHFIVHMCGFLMVAFSIFYRLRASRLSAVFTLDRSNIFSLGTAITDYGRQ